MDEEDALYAAALAGNDDAISKLDMKADRVDGWEETILHNESKKGNTERVRFILREFAHKNLLVKLDIYKQTALHMAVYDEHTEVAELLIDAARHLPVTFFQAFLRQGDNDMDTALHAAVKRENIAIVKLLVEADPSDTHIQNDKGKTPMYIAVENRFNDIVEIISTTCTAPSLDGPDGSTIVLIKNLDQGKSPGGTLYKIMDRYALYVATIGGDADAIAKLEMQADGSTVLPIKNIDQEMDTTTWHQHEDLQTIEHIMPKRKSNQPLNPQPRQHEDLQGIEHIMPRRKSNNPHNQQPRQYEDLQGIEHIMPRRKSNQPRNQQGIEHIMPRRKSNQPRNQQPGQYEDLQGIEHIMPRRKSNQPHNQKPGHYEDLQLQGIDHIMLRRKSNQPHNQQPGQYEDLQEIGHILPRTDTLSAIRMQLDLLAHEYGMHKESSYSSDRE